MWVRGTDRDNHYPPEFKQKNIQTFKHSRAKSKWPRPLTVPVPAPSPYYTSPLTVTTVRPHGCDAGGCMCVGSRTAAIERACALAHVRPHEGVHVRWPTYGRQRGCKYGRQGGDALHPHMCLSTQPGRGWSASLRRIKTNKKKQIRPALVPYVAVSGVVPEKGERDTRSIYSTPYKP